MKRLLNATAVVVASSLLLAGCGGGSDDETMETPDPAGPGDEMQDDTATLTGLLGIATNTEGNSSTAVKAAEEVAAKLTAEAVRGDSTTAHRNATTILTSRATVDMALADAMAAKSAAEELSESDFRDNVIAQLDAAIASINEDVETMEKHVDALGKDKDGMTRDAGAVAAGVASVINAAFTGADALADVEVDGDNVPTMKAQPSLVRAVSKTGMTWAEIVGSTSKMRIVKTATTTAEVDVAPVGGMTLTSAQEATEMDEFVPITTQVPDIEYKGIPGQVICAGEDCAVETVDGDGNTGVKKLVGSWYFTPDHVNEYYVPVDPDADDITYQLESYIQYGHWLAFTDGAATINRFVTPAGADAAGSGAWGSTAGLTDRKASYSGLAAGISVVKNSADEATGSGAFTADVDLTATFGASASVGGTISNFAGPAVGSGWMVKLEDIESFAGSAQEGVASTTTNVTDGTWKATSYGATNARPTGIYGEFRARFGDGDAAGVYATRQAE